MAVVRHDSSALYAEVLELLATLCARGTLHCARFVCQKLMSHSNQWFNWGFLIDTLVQQTRAPPHLPVQNRSSSGAVSITIATCHLLSAICSTRLAVSQPPPQLSSQALQTATHAVTPTAETFGPLIMELLSTHPDPMVKAACLGALSHFDFAPSTAKITFASLVAVLPTLVTSVSNIRDCCDGALAIELLACSLRLVQTVPLSRGRYGLDLQPLTHIVVHHIFMKVLADATQFTSAPRYWRLAALALRWLCLVMRGPLPLGTAGALNAVLVEPYADSDAVAADVAARSVGGNATAFAFRCLLTLDSPVFARAMSLLLLSGRGVEGLAECRRGGAAWPFMEQAVRAGLDVLRLLFQRDVLFCRLYGQQASVRLMGGAGAGLDAGDLLLAHQPLLREYAFPYPPAEDGASKMPASLNPFAGKRLWQSAAVAPFAGGAGGRRANPSYLALLAELVGVRSSPEIARLATYCFAQAALREPARVLQILQLEPWRLQCLSADLHDRILQPEEDLALAAATGAHDKWDARAEEQFMFEAMEMDVPPDAALQLDVASFRTGLPVCRDVDLVYQLADDSAVQAADLAAWARSLGWAGSSGTGAGLHGGASADVGRFRAAYLRGLDTQAAWLGAEAAAHASTGLAAPPPALAAQPCRLLALRGLVLLLGGVMLDDASGAACRLAQALLGLDPEGAAGAAGVDVDPARVGQPCPLDAVMEILEHPPPLPVLEDPSGPSGSAALRPRGPDRCTSQAVEQHVTYESALGIILGLMAAPSLRDVALRYICHAWPSRYEVLQRLLGLPWTWAPAVLRRVLLSQLAMVLQVLSWEMRLVQPVRMAPQPDSDKLDIVGHQRLEMKRVVAEHLQEVVRNLVAPTEPGSDARASPPFLVVAALELADACEPQEAATSLQPAGALFQDAEHEFLQAAECPCLAPSESGRLSLCLKLHDPHLFQCLTGRGRPSPHAGDPSPMFSLAAFPASGASGEGPPRPALGPSDLGASNEHACATFFAKLVFGSLSLFVSAVLYHLAGGMRPGVLARDPRVQVARAHLEALLPALDGPALASCSPQRLELLLRLATAFVVAAQRTEAPAPLAFVQDLFALFRGAALQPCATPEARHHVQQALLLVLQRMLPDPWGGPRGEVFSVLPEIAAEGLADLRRIVGVVLASARLAADAPPRVDCATPPAPSAALPLLVALLVRVPRQQLPEVFAASEHWQQLLSLLHAAWAPGPEAPARSLLRFQVTCVVAVLCQSPVLASAFFESAGLTAVLQPDLAQAARVRLAPAGLQVLDTVHPASLLVVLQVLAVVVSVLPAHRLVLHSALAWLERHRQPLMELLLWVARLPLSTAVEPQTPGLDGLDSPLLGAGRGGLLTAEMVSAAAAYRPGAQQGNALLVLCTPSVEDADHTIGLAALALNSPIFGGGSVSITSAQGAECDKIVALCYRCVVLFSELWASLWVGVLRCSAPAAVALRTEPLWCSMAQLESPFEAVLLSLLAQMASVVEPPHSDVTMGDTAGAGEVPRLGADAFALAAPPQAVEPAGERWEARLSPPKVTRLTVCMQVMHVWRHDSLTQQLRALSQRRGSPVPIMQPAAAGGFARDIWGAASATSSSSTSSQVGAVLQHVGQVRARASVLCTVFVHACNTLLGLRFVCPPPAQECGPLHDSPHLRFEGSSAHFRLLLTVVEMALHLLSEHLTALAALVALGGAAAATVTGAAVVAGVHTALPPTAGAPRSALVVQYLRALRQFSGAAGGGVAPVDLALRMGTAATGMPPPVKAADLTFAACAAERAEELLSELQGL